jgi:hypothetical protein
MSRDERFVSITLDLLRHSDTIQRTVNVQTITPKTRLYEQSRSKAETFPQEMV